jgi:hypothetical protein
MHLRNLASQRHHDRKFWMPAPLLTDRRPRNNGLFPTVRRFFDLYERAQTQKQNRKRLFGSYGWSVEAAKLIRNELLSHAG